ncbi:hypothetical protein WMY93_010654 [Mugilogobius chulae]|uniref:ETS domain-containing protein n=1 Tax=Mugilogobius chulae TaxID=88201 RepID=A0AAW0P8A2_9GOBI
MDYKMDGYLDQQVPFTLVNKSQGNGSLNRLLMAAKRKYMDTELPPQESEDLFQDLSQLQETWLTEAQVPDSDEQFVPDFHSENSVAFHSPPVTIKKEPQSPGSDPSQSCSHKQTFTYPSGEQCLYASAYEQKRAAAGAKSSCPGTPMSPMTQQHYSPNPLQPDGPTRDTNSVLTVHLDDFQLQVPGPFRRPYGPTSVPPPAPAFQRMPSAPSGHGSSGTGGPAGGGPGGGGEAVAEEAGVRAEGITDSTRTPACPTCSRALSRSTSTPCTRGRLRACQARDMGIDRTPIHTPTLTHIHTHISIGSPRPHDGQAGATDYTYEPDVPGCPSMYHHNDGYPNPQHSNEGYLFENDSRVVPEKFEGEVKQEGGGSGVFREGTPYQRRGSLQLWQFLVALLDDLETLTSSPGRGGAWSSNSSSLKRWPGSGGCKRTVLP